MTTRKRTTALTVRAAQAADKRGLEMRALSEDLINRMAFFRQAGITFGGERHVWATLGYPDMITPAMYLDKYLRGGLAGRYVDVLPKATWRGEMELEEDADAEKDTPWEAAWKALATRLELGTRLLQVDLLSQLSQYAVLFLGVQGDVPFNEELPKGKPDQLMYVQSYLGAGGPGSWQGFGDGSGVRLGSGDRGPNLLVAATILEMEKEVTSPRFGKPKFYALRRTDVSAPEQGKPIHWSRIIHVADRLLDNETYGQPCLERPWNLFEDLDKVTGGGSEAFWLRANQGTVLNVDKDAALTDDEKKDFNKKIKEFHHHLTRFMVLRKSQLQELGSDVANFASPSDALISQIAGCGEIPKRILVGSEMGELASSQDRENFRDQVIGRQTQHAGPRIVRQLANRLIAYGYLPTPTGGPEAYQVKWPHVQVMTEQEKSEGAKNWASTNQTFGAPVFTDSEIRKHWYDFGDLTDKETSNESTLTDLEKATLASTMAQVNKAMGVTVFTDDEIRKRAFNLEPLTDEQKVPIGAPERISVDQPPPEALPAGGAVSKPTLVPKPGVPKLTAAEEHAVVEVLAEALQEQDIATLHRMLGLGSPDQPRDDHGRFSNGGSNGGGATASSADYPKQFAQGRDTQEMYSDGHGHYTPERTALHERLIAKALAGTSPVPNPTAVVLGGGPASGKSSLVAAGAIDTSNAVTINADEFKTQLPEYGEQVATNPKISQQVHEESSDIAKALLARATSQSRNVILDGTGDSTITKLGAKTALMRAGGHEVVGSYVTVPVETALARAEARGKATGRYVPEEVTRELHAAVSQTFPEAIRQGLFDRFTLHDTTSRVPKLIASGKGAHLTIHDPAAWQAFLKKGSV